MHAVFLLGRLPFNLSSLHKDFACSNIYFLEILPATVMQCILSTDTAFSQWLKWFRDKTQTAAYNTKTKTKTKITRPRPTEVNKCTWWIYF